MFRLVLSFCLLFSLVCSVGCRMCCSPYDTCISAYIDRPDDYRGCGPMYRAGSILSGEYGMCQTDGGEIMYVGDSDGYYGNAGNYGVTTPISTTQPAVQRPAESVEFPPESTRNPPIGKPQGTPVPQPPAENLIPGPYGDPNGTIPTLQDIINAPRSSTIPESINQIPVTPPAKPKVNSPSFEDTPTETIPFSPTDTVPQDVFPPVPSLPTSTEGESPITLEELRRLDPSVQDLQIISIEEAAVESTVH